MRKNVSSTSSSSPLPPLLLPRRSLPHSSLLPPIFGGGNAVEMGEERGEESGEERGRGQEGGQGERGSDVHGGNHQSRKEGLEGHHSRVPQKSLRKHAEGHGGSDSRVGTPYEIQVII